MEIQDRETLGRFAREHHLTYELEPEVVEGEQRDVVGFEVRLYATHGESKLEAPGCPRCVELAGELRSFAERLISAGDAPRWTEITPPGAPALYQSAEVPGADEVALAMRVRRDPRDGGTAKPSDDPHVGEIRARLEAVGAHRR